MSLLHKILIYYREVPQQQLSQLRAIENGLLKFSICSVQIHTFDRFLVLKCLVACPLFWVHLCAFSFTVRVTFSQFNLVFDLSMLVCLVYLFIFYFGCNQKQTTTAPAVMSFSDQFSHFDNRVHFTLNIRIFLYLNLYMYIYVEKDWMIQTVMCNFLQISHI